jgi:hypothetical protein
LIILCLMAQKRWSIGVRHRELEVATLLGHCGNQVSIVEVGGSRANANNHANVH